MKRTGVWLCANNHSNFRGKLGGPWGKSGAGTQGQETENSGVLVIWTCVFWSYRFIFKESTNLLSWPSLTNCQYSFCGLYSANKSRLTVKCWELFRKNLVCTRSGLCREIASDHRFVHEIFSFSGRLSTFWMQGEAELPHQPAKRIIHFFFVCDIRLTELFSVEE